MNLFYVVISLIVVQRLIELLIAGKNEKWLRAHGAVEYGKEHYKFIVLLHSLFFISMIVEYNVSGKYYELNMINYFFLVFFLFLQLMRLWIIKSLGNYWNTKILRIPNAALVKSGLYKYFKHPNYIIVSCEIFIVPMIFNLYFTAIVFSLLNALILSIRIDIENQALEN